MRKGGAVRSRTAPSGPSERHVTGKEGSPKRLAASAEASLMVSAVWDRRSRGGLERPPELRRHEEGSGTGAGMFLDTAFLIRKLNDELSNVRLVLEALILLPTAFSNDHKHRVFANSYAALMEI